jgi:hypothetical protein
MNATTRQVNIYTYIYICLFVQCIYLCMYIFMYVCMVPEIYAMIIKCELLNEGPGNECYEAAGIYIYVYILK